ncbi:hypothetical protein EVA_13167 [gut metagenome]|uniref:Uncharacterized protein n=1 Tax=gut metagenome TaxID=749906 RepID=J9CFE5_9ZZZZ
MHLPIIVIKVNIALVMENRAAKKDVMVQTEKISS